jgi:hypothetical protein
MKFGEPAHAKGYRVARRRGGPGRPTRRVFSPRSRVQLHRYRCAGLSTWKHRAFDGLSINNLRQIVGSYVDSVGNFDGFVYSSGRYVTVDAPGAIDTDLYGINDFGQIVGTATYSNGASQNFIDTHGAFTNIYNAISFGGLASPTNDKDHVFGSILLNSDVLNACGVLTPVNLSGAPGAAFAFGFNNLGQFTGLLFAGTGDFAFIDSKGVYTLIDDPHEALGTDDGFGINNLDQVVGVDFDSAGNNHRFVYTNGRFTTIYDPKGSLAMGGTEPVATELRINWNDTSSGTLAESDVEWGVAGGATSPVTQPRQVGDNNNTYLATGLKPSTSYNFRVRDCDQLTCTDWSNWLPITTQATNQVNLLLSFGGKTETIGTTTPTSSGGFSPVTVTIPANAALGANQLSAQLGGSELASLTITAVGPSQAATPILAVIDPNTNAVLQTPRVESTGNVSVRGQNFAPGSVPLYVDSKSGPQLGTTTAAANGTFTAKFLWPSIQAGQHTIAAYTTVNGQPAQARAAVYSDPLPT